jgi:D-psicose/D-tagatose/L-ribulose 3-epimerase
MRYAVCNELFRDLPFEQGCRLTAAAGFTGLEIAPFTLDEDPGRISRGRAAELRRVMEGAGLACAGMHWLLAAPPGLHVTTDDAALRARSWDALKRVAALCGALGGRVMVFGSPKQRTAEGVSVERARERFVEGLRSVAPALEQAGVKLLVEALSPEQTNLVTTAAEAREVIAAVASPWVRGMFDFHNAREEKLAPAQLIDGGFELIEHVHLNTREGSYPREPGPALRDAFAVLRRRGYSGWVSLEIFTFEEPPAAVLEATMRTIRALEA